MSFVLLLYSKRFGRARFERRMQLGCAEKTDMDKGIKLDRAQAHGVSTPSVTVGWKTWYEPKEEKSFIADGGVCALSRQRQTMARTPNLAYCLFSVWFLFYLVSF